MRRRIAVSVLLLALASVALAEEVPAPAAATSDGVAAPSQSGASAAAANESPAPGTSPDPAATPDGAAPPPANVLTKAPTLKRFVDAPYPPEAEKEKVQGSVVLAIVIGADGKVADAQVLKPAGHGFDEAALAAVKQFEFDPAEIDNVPAAVQVHYRYEFVLRAPEPEPVAVDAPAKPGVVSFEGRALERGTRVPMASAGIVAEKDGVTEETVSDADGHFKFTDLVPGSWRITIMAPSFEKYETREDVVTGEVTVATYYVRRRGGEFEVTVRAKREKKEVARRTLTLEEIRKIPGTQGDAIRVVQNLPGVARTPLNLGPLVVRGGRPGDTRTYIDGQFVPLLFHFGGLTAVINSEFLDTLDFYPGNIPARYGRSIAGAVDVNTRAGRKERVRGYANVGLTEATGFAEGPLGKKGTFMASVRRSYIDAVLPVVAYFVPALDSLAFTVAPRYWDYQLKTDFDFGRDELSFFLFGSDDKLSFVLSDPGQVNAEGRSDVHSAISFHRLTTRWKRKLTSSLEHKLSATVGTDYTSIGAGGDLYLNLRLNTLTVREDLTQTITKNFSLHGGLDLIAGTFRYEAQGPLPPPPGEFFNPLLNDQLQIASDGGWIFQPALWIDAVWTPLPGLKLVPGMRVDYESYTNRTWFDPRATAFYELTDKLLLKASAGLYHQPPSPEKLTKTFGNPNLIEEGSAQYAAGFEWQFGGRFNADLQFYYKDIFNEGTRAQQLTTQQAQAAFGNQQLSNTGEGRAYGTELLLRREPGDGLFGWIALSLGNTERRSAPGEPWTQSFLNQRYNIVAVVSKKFPWDIDAGVRIRWTEGSPSTDLIGGIYDSDSDQYLPLPSPERRTSRRPDFFQIDLRVDRRWVFETWILEAYIDILNVTNRRNAEGTNYNFDFTQSQPTRGLPIIPAFGVKGEF